MGRRRRTDPKQLHLVVFHAPPKTPTSTAARAEAYQDLAALLAGLASFVVLADWNSLSEQRRLARRHKGWTVAGKKIDAALLSAGLRGRARYVTRVRDGFRWIRLGSDHGHALKLTIRTRRLGRARVVFFYNVGAGRHNGVVQAELAAMCAGRRVVGVALAESIGYCLPSIAGYRRHRDLTSPSRRNLALYTRRTHTAKATKARWVDQRITWARTQHPGQHPPRSILWAPISLRPRRR